MDAELYIPASYIKEQAAKCGFDACGVAKASVLTDFEKRYSKWLELGYNANMSYMEKYLDKRFSPSHLNADGVSVISVLLSYKPSQVLVKSPFVAQYAYSEDYHRTIKQKLFRLIDTIQTDFPAFKATPYVDTAPISDKMWAARCGLGWIGKNTLLVNESLGSWVNIGELVCNIVSDYDEEEANHCGECTRCVDACPNGAITPNGVNANRCNAYHTIENKADALPDDIDLRGYVFGCDICQKACPYNADVIPRLEVTEERMSELQKIDTAGEADFKKIIKHSAMERIKYSQLRRNIDKTKNKH